MEVYADEALTEGFWTEREARMFIRKNGIGRYARNGSRVSKSTRMGAGIVKGALNGFIL
jgi:hypothetical protein